MEWYWESIPKYIEKDEDDDDGDKDPFADLSDDEADEWDGLERRMKSSYIAS